MTKHFSLKAQSLGKFSFRILSLLDQILFSAANFILTLMLAKYYSDVELAGYGIGLSIALLIQSTQRTCYVVQNSILSPAIFRRRASKVLGQHLIIWAFIIVVEFGISAILLWAQPDAYHWSILASTIVCSLIYAQLDFDRLVLIKHDKIVDPLLASVAFLLLNVFLFIMIPRWHIGFMVTMILVGLYAVLKIARLVLLTGKPDFFWGWRLACKDFKKYFMSSVFGVAGYSGHSHGPLFILGSVAAPLQSAAFVAMRGLMQPLMVIIRSLDVIDKNIFQSGTTNTPTALRGVLLRQLAIYGALSACAVMGSFVLGPWVVQLAYGDKYMNYQNILVGWSLIFSMLALTFPLETVIVKLNRLHRYNAWRLMAGATGMALAFLLCPEFGAMGAILASIGGWIVSVGCALWILRDAMFGIPIPTA